ncbi:MAG: hypothetical protein DCE90_10800 [Pseudanabaena sp.]|nr:MAG: hypothetical protein DCE90_10800 [Pseudanabaena sp.]
MSNKPNRFLFEVDQSRYDNVTINWQNSPLSEFGIYAGAYRKAAENLTTILLAGNSFHDIDPCPIIFLYRHSIELYLKEICLLGYDLFNLLDKQLLLHGRDLEIDKLWNNHKLSPLVNVLRKISDQLNWKWDLEDSFNHFKNFVDFEAAIAEIDELDSGSYTFRYPYDKNTGTASLDQEFSFSISLFQDGINIILDALDGASMQLKSEISNLINNQKII